MCSLQSWYYFTYDYDWLTSDLKISAGGSLRIAHNKIS